MAFPCCMSSEEKEQYQKSKRIDNQIAKERVYFRRKVKILLLGTGESGKTTFLKQMRIIHGKDYALSDLEEFRPIIFANIIKLMKVLCDACRVFHLPWGDPPCQILADKLLSFQHSTVCDLNTFQEYVGSCALD